MGTPMTLWSPSELLGRNTVSNTLQHPSTPSWESLVEGSLLASATMTPLYESIRSVPVQYLSRLRLLTCYLTSPDTGFHL